MTIPRLQLWQRIGLASALVAGGLCACQTSIPAQAKEPRLSDLNVLVTIGGGTPMTPAFSPDQTDYTIRVQSDIATVGIEAAANSGAREGVLVGGKSVHSGTLIAVGLAVGDNSIPVIVTGRDATTFAYSVHVSRENMQPVVDRFLQGKYTDALRGVTLGYRLFVPERYDSAASYPLIVFLHGAGERGADNEAQLTANQGATVWAKPEEQANHPCIVLAPQCPRATQGSGWTSLMSSGFSDPFKPRPELQTVFDLIKQVQTKYTVDRKRIYGVGLSMGGFGVWALALSHPDLFAAVIAASAGADPAKLAGIPRLPAWIFHAAKDPIVPVSFARATFQALKRAGGSPKYTEYPQDAYFGNTPHESWIPAFSNEELRNWLFLQSGH